MSCLCCVKEAVFLRTVDLFKLDVDLIFYDTTTCSFAIDAGDEGGEGRDLRRLGHAKDGTWSPQVVVALAVTREGLAMRSWVFAGNTVDVTTVARLPRPHPHARSIPGKAAKASQSSPRSVALIRRVCQ